MSSGRDCIMEEVEPGQWMIDLENDEGRWNDPEYDRYGPITGTMDEAYHWLADRVGNPGGCSASFHKDTTDPNARSVDFRTIDHG